MNPSDETETAAADLTASTTSNARRPTADGGPLDVVRRLGLVDPTRLLASVGGVARWGPSIAAPYRAAAMRHPNRAAVIDDRGRLTYARLDLRSSSSARGLFGIGLRPGQDIGLLCRNHRDAVEMNLAAAKAGLRVVQLNTGFAPAQLGEVLQRESVVGLVHDAVFGPAVAASGFRGPTVVTDVDAPDAAPDPYGDRSISIHRLRRAGRRHPILPPRRPAPPVLLTSGTTGSPKGARRAGLGSDARSSIGILERIPYRHDDVFMIAAPLFHAWGLSQLVVAASFGAPVILRRTFDPAETISAVLANDATVLAVVPVMLQRILRVSDPVPAGLGRLRIVASSGSALPAGLVERWLGEVGENLYNLYGSTEVGQATIASPADLKAAPDTAGRVVPGCRVEILDADGQVVPDGDLGRIFVRSGAGFDGYTGGGGKEVVGDLMATGDVGRFDAAGRLYVTGRSDDMIVSGGENVFPQEVEDVLSAASGVAEVAVVGVADEAFGQRLAAFVVPDAEGSVDVDGLRELVAERLARHKVPRDVVLLDTLPRTTTGKVLRARLAERLGG